MKWADVPNDELRRIKDMMEEHAKLYEVYDREAIGKIFSARNPNHEVKIHMVTCAALIKVMVKTDMGIDDKIYSMLRNLT